VGTFARRGLAASLLDRCGSPVPITRDAAISSPSVYIGRGTRVLPLRLIPQELFARRSPGYLPVVVLLDAVLDPGVAAAYSSLPSAPLSPAPNMRGSAFFPKYRFLGAMCQIQGYTLHLAALVTSPFVLSDLVVSLPGG